MPCEVRRHFASCGFSSWALFLISDPLKKMYYIREGKLEFVHIECDDNILDRIEVPDPDTYSDLVQFSIGCVGCVAAVDRDGYVWLIRNKVATRILGIDNIRSVYLYQINHHCVFSMITNEDRLVNMSLNSRGKVLSTTFVSVPEKVVATNLLMVLTIDGDIYRLTDSRICYVCDMRFPKIMRMTSHFAPTLLSEDGRVYDDRGEIAFNGEVHSIHNEVLIAKNGDIYMRPYSKKLGTRDLSSGAYGPDDVLQMRSAYPECDILYKDGTLTRDVTIDDVPEVVTIHNVYRIAGVSDLVAKSKKAR